MKDPLTEIDNLFWGLLLVALVLTALVIVWQPYIFRSDPKPNYPYIEEVSEWAGHNPCCDSTWSQMCNDYKEEKNISFDCFTQ